MHFIAGHRIGAKYLNDCFYFSFSIFYNRLQIESENKVLPVYSLEAEFARPLWIFGMNSYEFLQSHTRKNLIACSYR